ncbi:hypothetical protein C823_007810 [Eubacterium plexicaudatum ASF492]|uniref:Uncharacterized protein n=1 Tax=Eubacterium plexicaudatum ASF492 TaxID=1235802 RepID=N2A3X0_9FIRM|nr:hypothetical protein C823_007810 [Eubacterium plexicaudatum ASF492]
MNCRDCYWSKTNNILTDEEICCNENSSYYNQIISTEKVEQNGCENGETKQTVDYKNMTAWEFASRYYM